MDSIKLLKDITPNAFFRDYWEKKPLVIKNVLSHSEDYISKELMKEMALEDEIESRFLFQHDDGNWSLFHNPITEDFFTQYKNEKWTLINHAVNLFHRPMYDLQKSCHFIPQWNFDDIMVSYSMPGGNVGPHIDSYNVFIIQGHGKKKWMINTDPDTNLVPEQELKMLSGFVTEDEYILEAGDMIYIPPHVAHYGIALTEGMSYSLGFNSLKPASFIDAINRLLQRHYDDDQILPLPFKKETTDKNRYEFTRTIHHNLTGHFSKLLNAKQLEMTLSEMLTTPRYWPETNDSIDFDEFLDLYEEQPIYREPYLRFNFLNEVLFINGESYLQLSTREIHCLIDFLNHFPMEPLPKKNFTYRSYQILYRLYLEGAIFFGVE